MIYVIIWLVLGMSGFIFWYGKENDITTVDLVVALSISTVGPLAWLIGFIIHGKGIVIIKKRNKG